MILGKGFFITPSDSVAIIAANAQQSIPYFRSGPKVLFSLVLTYSILKSPTSQKGKDSSSDIILV